MCGNLLVDIIGAVITGLCTGIGVGVANWINEKKIRSKLDDMDIKLTSIKKEGIIKTIITNSENMSNQMMGKNAKR
jgi:hypothetical protein